jgi:acetoacetate decarboxylase
MPISHPGFFAQVLKWLKQLVAGLFGNLLPPPPPVRFPGPGDFIGSYDPRAADMQDGAQSTYDGSIVVTLIDRALVANVLPSGFTLASRSDGGSEHPVIHLVGHQRNLKLVNGGVLQQAPDPDYQEVILLVPFVLRGNGTKFHSFVVRMYLDDLAAIAIGNTVFAYNKELGALAESGPSDNLTMQVWLLLVKFFQGNVQLTGQWIASNAAGTAVPRWSDLQRIFDMPILGVDTLVGTTAVVREVCSYWEWDYTNAEVCAATSQHRFFHPFRYGMDGWVNLGSLSSAADGAVAIRGLRWRLARQPPLCSF